ncbi:MAG TPA: M20/M25/M40 family metallo-hydrolase [Polyangia bacterium]|nr:M20/M25/M40 family metallo-hydrolase [Polyangia bacterium]
MRAILVLATLLGVAHADETTTFARKLLDELVATDTSNPPGNEEKAAKLIASKLRAAGIEPVIVPFAPGRANVIARLRGDGSKRPLVLLAHLDVVGAAGQPWTVPPFTVTEKDGWMYGRGVTDDKSWAAMATAIVIELKRQKAPLHRDIILALTGDEESGGAGIRYVLEHRKELLGNAEFALNEGGGVLLDATGKPRLVSLGTAEKTFQDFSFTAHGVGGHSSVPNDENAIYRLARALDKLSGYKFPTRLSPAVRDSLRATAVTQPPERARAMRAAADVKGDAIPPDLLAIMDAHPLVRALTRTTCVATMMTGGTRDNALPVTAQATVNCRIMPVDTIDFVQGTLKTLVSGLADVAIIPDVGVGPEVANSGPVRAAVEKATRAVYGPDVPVVARIGLGASDSRFLRRAGIQSYGIGVLAKPDELVRNAHGPDEAAPVASFPLGVAFLRDVVRELVL